MQTHLKNRQQQRQNYRDDLPGAARVDDSVAAGFDDSKSKKRGIIIPRPFFFSRGGWGKAEKSRDVVALSIVFLLTFFLSYSLTSSSSSFESNSFGPAVQRGLALRKKFAEQSSASSNPHAYRYSNSHHALEYSTRRQLLASAYPEIDEISPPVTTCSVTGESYVVQGADTAGDFGSRMCCSSYYATEVTFCGYTTTPPSFEYAMHVTSGKTWGSTTSISSGATETGEGDCKTYDTSAAPAKICVYTECQTTDMADCTFSEHSVTFTHAPWPSPPPPPSPPPAQAAVDATMELTGYSAAEFGEAQKTAFKKGMAAYLNVGADAITVKSVTNVVDASRRKLQAATDKVKIEFTVETTTYADISDVEEKLVTEDSTKLNEMVTTLSAQADLTVTAVTAPVSLTKLAPPPSPPPEAQTVISGAMPRLTRLLSIASLVCAVSMTYVL